MGVCRDPRRQGLLEGRNLHRVGDLQMTQICLWWPWRSLSSLVLPTLPSREGSPAVVPCGGRGPWRGRAWLRHPRPATATAGTWQVTVSAVAWGPHEGNALERCPKGWGWPLVGRRSVSQVPGPQSSSCSCSFRKDMCRPHVGGQGRQPVAFLGTVSPGCLCGEWPGGFQALRTVAPQSFMGPMGP